MFHFSRNIVQVPVTKTGFEKENNSRCVAIRLQKNNTKFLAYFFRNLKGFGLFLTVQKK